MALNTTLKNLHFIPQQVEDTENFSTVNYIFLSLIYIALTVTVWKVDWRRLSWNLGILWNKEELVWFFHSLNPFESIIKAVDAY